MTLRPLMVLLAALLLSAVDACGQTASHDRLRRNPLPADAEAPALPDLALVDAFPDLEFDRPVWLVCPPDESGRFFVVEQDGQVSWFQPDEAQDAAPFLDISGRVYRGHNEEGLLGLAFHPQFAKNGQFYVWYSAKRPRRHVLSRFTVSRSDPDRADPGSEQILLEIEKPYGNHNGSTLLFGPDGLLYFSVGDGGAGGDPHDHGQNLASWLGKIHRIDVDRKSPGREYAVPPDNPFVGVANARPEIWALGLRNVWRMSFDREQGDLWAGDVGQDQWEEVDVIVKGGNYGWRIREGAHDFGRDRADRDRPGRNRVGLIEPVIEYEHRDGTSITGGYVYRGKSIPALAGAYVYADFTLGTIWALRWDGKQVTAWKRVLDQPKNIASFAEDRSGELWVCAFDGRIYRVGARN